MPNQSAANGTHLVQLLAELFWRKLRGSKIGEVVERIAVYVSRRFAGHFFGYAYAVAGSRGHAFANLVQGGDAELVDKRWL